MQGALISAPSQPRIEDLNPTVTAGIAPPSTPPKKRGRPRRVKTRPSPIAGDLSRVSNELFARAKAGDRIAQGEILNRVDPAIRVLANRGRPDKNDFDDRCQELRIVVLTKGLRDFDPARGTTFNAFIWWWMYSKLRVVRTSDARRAKGYWRTISVRDEEEDGQRHRYHGVPDVLGSRHHRAGFFKQDHTNVSDAMFDDLRSAAMRDALLAVLQDKGQFTRTERFLIERRYLEQQSARDISWASFDPKNRVEHLSQDQVQRRCDPLLQRVKSALIEQLRDRQITAL